jgi:2-oxoglutarate dehydrogenase E2 component (dihydrolipoamide succinyltransferase)
MEHVKIALPSMGEGIFEATITQWLVTEGSEVQEDDSLVEVATDKVDSEIPAPANGKIIKLLIEAGEIAKVGQEIAILEIEGDTEPKHDKLTKPASEEIKEAINNSSVDGASETNIMSIPHRTPRGKFLSPLVRNIAQVENISINQLDSISASGLNGRITKDDIELYLSSNTGENKQTGQQKQVNSPVPEKYELAQGETIIEMDRMRAMIAENMVRSKQVSPHVTSFHEVDLTNMVLWRLKNKAAFENKYGKKLTFTPIFIEAVAAAIRKYPMINISVHGNQIIKKNAINIGMAVALPDGNLIVPVIKNADELNLSGLAGQVNDLSFRARNKQLQPAEIQGGTFTITNVGTFGNVSGTPIIPQPQVAILAVGAIKKKPAVIETPQGDVIGIRHQMILSMSYDHRVVDGSLGGMFIKEVADQLEAFDQDRQV